MSKLLIAGFMAMFGVSAFAVPSSGPKAPGGHPRGQSTVARRPSDARHARGESSRRGARDDHEHMSRSERMLERIAQLEERGKSAAVQIAAFIVDPDEEVSDEAYRAWSSLVEDMDADRRARAIVQAAQAIQAGGHGGPSMPPPMVVPVQQPIPQPVVVPQQVVVPQVQ